MSAKTGVVHFLTKINTGSLYAYLLDVYKRQERITIVTKTPQCLCDLIRGGYELEADITVGNMSNGANKRRVSKNICVTEADVENFNYLSGLGYKLYSQMVPSEAPSPFMPMLEAALKKS